jgi:hypothetical protein
LDIWVLIDKLHQISRPQSLNPSAFYTSIDGLPIYHTLLGDSDDPCPIIHNYQVLRDRIFQRFKANHGLTFLDGKDLPDMLPRSSRSVFSHGDIHHSNILLDNKNSIIALLDMESAGFLPDYWEYAMMMRPSMICHRYISR